MSQSNSLEAWKRIHSATRGLRAMLRAQPSSYNQFSTAELIRQVECLNERFCSAWAVRHANRAGIIVALCELRRARQALAFRLVRSA